MLDPCGPDNGSAGPGVPRKTNVVGQSTRVISRISGGISLDAAFRMRHRGGRLSRDHATILALVELSRAPHVIAHNLESEFGSH